MGVGHAAAGAVAMRTRPHGASIAAVARDNPGDLVRRARGGDDAAWPALVDRYAGLVWAVVRGYRLGSGDADDVVQTTWLRLVEHLDRLSDPDRVGAWLATTARNEALRMLRLAGRHVPIDDTDVDLEERAGALSPVDVDERLLRAERDAALWRAFACIPLRCQALLRVLSTDPAPSYEEVGAALAMPVGSIGPTRARCLAKLREELALAGTAGIFGEGG